MPTTERMDRPHVVAGSLAEWFRVEGFRVQGFTQNPNQVFPSQGSSARSPFNLKLGMLGRQGNTRLTISPHGEQCQSARSALACVSEAPFKLEQEDYIV